MHNEIKDKTAQQSSCNDIIVIESHSINHISTLTVFKGHQGNNQTHKPHKKNRNSDRQKLLVSANVKSECFLSNNRRCELVPVYVHEVKPQASLSSVENQQPNQGTNQTPDKPVGGDCGRSQSPTTTFEMAYIGQTNGKSCTEKEMPDPPPDAQPITTSDNQLTSNSDQSKPELCIYEEIQFSSPRSGDADENQRDQSSGDEPSNLTVNESGSSHTDGEYSTRTNRTGSDVTCKRGKEQKVYSSVMKSSVINHLVQDCRPRITVVSTSL